VNSPRTQRFSFRARTAEDTRRYGTAWGRAFADCVLVGLEGPLGAGKTTLAAGLCAGLGVRDAVLSPTFVLEETFRGRLPVVHADLYRLEYESEVEELGIYERVGNHVILVEWSDRCPALRARCDAVITMRPGDGDERVIAVECVAGLDGVFAGADRE